MNFSDAIKVAGDLDLIVVNEKLEIPIIKLIDYGKFTYNKKKNLKKQKTNKVKNKEIKFSLNIAVNDCNIKINRIKKFISMGHRVKVSLFLRGRERTQKDSALEFMNELKVTLDSFASTIDLVKLVGNTITLNYAQPKRK